MRGQSAQACEPAETLVPPPQPAVTAAFDTRARSNIASNHHQITAVDLFAGAGGFSLAAHNAGIKILAAVEYDKHSCSTYEKNFNERMGLGVRLFPEDINSFAPDRLMAETPGLANGCDLVIGGPPCQGFSSHRFKDKGVDDPRNELLIRYFEFVKALKPKAFLVENVPGLLWPRHESYLKRFKVEAEHAGYKIYAPEKFNARDFGVPQNRQRIFILGVQIGSKIDISWPPDSTHGKPGNGEKPDWLKAEIVFKDPLREGDPNATHMKHSNEMLERFRNTPPNGGSRANSGFQLDCHKNHDGHKDVYGRIDPEKPGPTMTTACINPSKGRFVHPTEHHGITLRHAARFQSFPDDFIFEGGLMAGGIQIGNAVPVTLGEHLLIPVVKALIPKREI